MLVIKADRNLNLHTSTFSDLRDDKQGLVFVPAGQAVKVPDDVQDHPLFKVFVKAGAITILKKGAPDTPEAQSPDKKAHEPGVQPDPEALGKGESEHPRSSIPKAESAEDEDKDEDEDEEGKDEEEEKKPPVKPTPTPIKPPVNPASQTTRPPSPSPTGVKK